MWEVDGQTHGYTGAIEGWQAETIALGKRPTLRIGRGGVGEDRARKGAAHEGLWCAR